MKDISYRDLVYPQRIKWIHQQLESGKQLDEILDISVNAYQPIVPQETILSCKVNNEVMERWDEFTSIRTEKTEALLAMALQEFMSNHKQAV